MVIIVAAIFDFIVGTLIGPLDDQTRAKGFTGFNSAFQHWLIDNCNQTSLQYDLSNTKRGLSLGLCEQLPPGKNISTLCSYWEASRFHINRRPIINLSNAVEDLYWFNWVDVHMNVEFARVQFRLYRGKQWRNSNTIYQTKTIHFIEKTCSR